MSQTNVQNQFSDKRAFLLSLRMPVYVGLAIAACIVSVHGLASSFGWYWTFRWFDNPMHVLGGLLAGYFGIVAYAIRVMDKARRPSLSVALLSALAVGIAWEVLEYWYGLSGLDPIHRFDAIKDLINDMMGGVIALLVWDLFIYKKLNK